MNSDRTLVVGGDWIDAPEDWVPAVRIRARRWNGWAVPVMTREQLEQLAAQMDGINNELIVAPDGTANYHSSNLDDEFFALERNPDGTYTVDLGWCFDEWYLGACPHCGERVRFETPTSTDALGLLPTDGLHDCEDRGHTDAQ